MFRIFILLSLFILFSLKGLTQEIIKLDTTSIYWEYYNLIQKAEYENLQSNFKQSDSIYNIAFEKVKRPFKHDYFNAFNNAKNVSDCIALNYLLKAIELGLTKKELRKSGAYKKLTENEKKVCLKKLNKTQISRNDSLYKIIKKMIRKDQRARAFWTDWLKWDKQVKIMDKVDRKNAQILLNICKLYGWPGFSIIGENTDSKYDVADATFLILHFNKEEYQKLLPYMIKAVENGEIYPYHLARVTDYLYMANVSDSANCKILEIKQIYGTMYFANRTIIPYGKEDEVNKRRKLIGLGAISLYARLRNLNLPDKEKIRVVSELQKKQ